MAFDDQDRVNQPDIQATLMQQAMTTVIIMHLRTAVTAVMAATEDITEAELVSMAVRRRNIHIRKADLVRQWLRQLVWVLSSGWQHQPLCLV